MSLSICEDCRTVEGKWREPTLKERQDYGMESDGITLPEDMVCCTCDSVGTHRGVPEHDDMDMER